MFEDFKPFQEIPQPIEQSKEQLDWIISRLMEQDNYNPFREPERDLERLVIFAGAMLTGEKLPLILMGDTPRKLKKRYREWKQTH